MHVVPDQGTFLADLTFLYLAGARFTVRRQSGQGNPLDRMAARTRSRASRTAASGRPTMVKPGRPLETWTSTDTGCPTAPLSVAEATVASLWGNGRTRRAPGPGNIPTRSFAERLATRVSPNEQEAQRGDPWSPGRRIFGGTRRALNAGS